jgi:hypothetical protein
MRSELGNEIVDVARDSGKDGTGASLIHLMARVARRPGRWRQKMTRRGRFDDEAPRYPEAA